MDSCDLLYYDVQLLKENLQECSSVKDIMRLFLHNNYKYLYPRLYRTYVFILTLPVTVASNERTFSRLKLIKNHLRSKMFDDRLMNLLLCSSEKDLLVFFTLGGISYYLEEEKQRDAFQFNGH